MNQFLKKISDKLNAESLNEWEYDDLFWICDDLENPICEIINKYSLMSNSATFFSLTDNELKIVSEESSHDYNILIKSLLDYLIACSSKRNTSNLVEDCLKVLELYFEHIDDENRGLSINVIERILKWTIKKFPKNKENIKNLILNKILKDSRSALNCLFFIDFFIRDKELCNILSCDDYEKIFEKYFIDKTDEGHIQLYLRFYGEYLTYIKENNKISKKQFMKKYCDFVINNINLIPNRTKQVLLQKTRDYMDELKEEYSDENYSLIDEHLEIANKEALQSLHSFTVELPKEKVELINKKIIEQRKNFKQLSNAKKIDYLLNFVYPLNVLNIKKALKKTSSSLAEAIHQTYLDSEGNVINYKKLTEQEMFSIKATQSIGIQIGLFFDFYVNPFFLTFELDEEASKNIKNIFENNRLVEGNRIEELQNLFLEFFKQNFKYSIYSIVEELEESLRFYFKNEKMNIYKRNGKRDLIGLSNIFNDKEKNSYRDKLSEIIDEDFYFTLKWLLVDSYGFGLRHKIAHRIDSQNLYKFQYSVYAVIQILRLYWGFQKN